MLFPKSQFLISAPSSNSGKTTVTLGLLRVLTNRGLDVQPFKCGPDYIDAIHHKLAAGKRSINLDMFMSSEKHVRTSYSNYSANADVSVTEGVMGLFDGADRMQGSSAAIAELLDIPVVLVVNAKSMAYSAAALLYGFRNFHRTIKVVGAIFNFVNSESHYRFLQEACADVGIESLGYLPQNNDFAIPSRHLGLQIDQTTDYEKIIHKLAAVMPQTIDLDRLLEISLVKGRAMAACTGEGGRKDDNAAGGNPYTIAIARDEAFSFTYHQNIEVLAGQGKIVWFSPLHDEKLPETDFLYLPGGYPELYAQKLSENDAMRASIADYCSNGGAAFAECGGLMYLGRGIINSEGIFFGMAGVLDVTTSMQNPKMTLGYRVADWDGLEIRGHEFHYSGLESSGQELLPVKVTNARGIETDTKFYRKFNTYASYMHLYWADQPEFIRHLLNPGTTNGTAPGDQRPQTQSQP